MYSRRNLINGTSRVVRRLAGLGPCERGAVAPLVGFAMIVLVGAVGVAIDIGRGQVAQSKLQSSLDSAGLAAGAMVGQTLDSDDLKPEAEKYLRSNFAGETIDATITEFHLELAEDQSVVTLQAKATLPTTFMRVFGQQKIDVAARSEITRETKGLEVALVLDITGSMNDAAGNGDPTKKITALKSAGNSLIDILFGNNATVDDLWVGIVPFSLSVNIGPTRTNWLSDYATYTTQNLCIGATSGTPKCPSSPTPLSSAKVSTTTNPVTLVDRYMNSNKAGWYFKNTTTNEAHTWRGCILERWTNNRDVTDDTPATQKFQTFFADDTTYNVSAGQYSNNWRGPTNSSNTNDGKSLLKLDRDGDSLVEELGANRGCPEYPITPMTNTKATLKTALNDIVWPNGYTHINVGAVWGWRLLSPKWRGVWGGTMDANNLPLNYHEELSQKAMILMTDGFNTMTNDSYTAYGLLSQNHVGTTDPATSITKLNEKTTAVCNAMKTQGVLIYTIVFGNGSDPAAKAMMKGCASEEDFYFDSPTSTDLSQAFKAIGDSLSKLRVSK